MAMPRNNSGTVLAVVGAQYGSEGKGVIVAHLANEFDIHVRVGGPNAGHSLKFGSDNQVFKMQCLPCGWVNPNALLIIGRGGLIDFPQLVIELDQVETVMPGVRSRLIIDSYAGVLSESHHHEEGGVAGELHQRIGSTGHGVGAARHARMSRDPSRFTMAYQVAHQYGLNSCLRDNVNECIIGDVRLRGKSCLLEGTQGSGLSLIHGPWPYVTSADTNAAQMAADIGLPPRMVNKTLLVARTYPIRVAGNSGPLENEITWEALSYQLRRPVKEQTTVTKKVRRIAEWDNHLFHRACVLNDPTSIALTFADYVDPTIEGKSNEDDLTVPVRTFISRVQRIAGAPVVFIGTGGERWSVIDRGQAL
jgi:adenylosuccinate synthase